MFLRVMWLGIGAYFLLFWYAVEDLGLAMACTFFLVVIGLKITHTAVKALASSYQSQPDQTQPPHPGSANLNRPPR